MKIGDWLRAHKEEAALGAGGIVVTIALYMRSRSSSSSSSGSDTSSGTLPEEVADTTGTDDYTGLEDQVTGLASGIESQLQQIQSQLPPAGSTTSTSSGSSSSGSSAPSDLVPDSDQVIVGGGYSVAGGKGPGGGYGSGVVQGSSGAYFSPIATLQDSESLFSSNPGAVDYEPALGVFDPVTGQNQFSELEGEGTTLFTPYSTAPAGSQAA